MQCRSQYHHRSDASQFFQGVSMLVLWQSKATCLNDHSGMIFEDHYALIDIAMSLYQIHKTHKNLVEGNH